MKITVTDVHLDDPVVVAEDGTVTLADLIAEAVAAEVGAHATAGLADIVASIREETIRTAVREAVQAAMTGPPGNVPVTLAEMIRAEARAQIERGDGYQGTATPLKQVVAAEVYTQLHAEVVSIVGEARERIRGQVQEEIAAIVARTLGRMG